VKLASGDSLRSQHHAKDVVTVDPHGSETPRGLTHLALILVTELGACLQMVTSDIAHATDLGEASTRWLQRLMALAALIERAQHSTYPVGHTQPHLEPRSPLPRHSDARPPKLTARERELMALTRKGIPPRTIARRLQLSVETVYTHLRNARRKQRALDSLNPS
jgi:DNA-binding CsgD family transcriptional regulator